MVMTRDKDDEKELYNLLGDKEYRKFLDTEFKLEKSNFHISINVDMWITGFDVPCLTMLYNDKPLSKHTLIQTISRVNRKFGTKECGFIIDYIGIREEMKKAMKNMVEKSGHRKIWRLHMKYCRTNCNCCESD